MSNNEKKENLRLRTIIGLIIVFIMLGYYFYNINYNSRGIINKVLNKIEGKTLDNSFSTKIKSANLSTDYTVEQAIKDIEELELNTINLPVVINIDDITSSDVSIDENSLERAEILLKELKGKKINIILEPYPYIANGSMDKTDFNPTNKSEFLLNWKNDVIKPLIDEIAIPYRVDALNIATGFTHLKDMEEELCEIINFARKYYKGLITYRSSFWTTSNWKDEVTKKQVD